MFTFKGGDNGKMGGGYRKACLFHRGTAQYLNICYSCTDVDFPLLSEPIVTVFTFRGGDNGKMGGGDRKACLFRRGSAVPKHMLFLR